MKGRVENVRAYGEPYTVQVSGSTGLRRSHGKVPWGQAMESFGCTGGFYRACFASQLVCCIYIYSYPVWQKRVSGVCRSWGTSLYAEKLSDFLHSNVILDMPA